MAKRGRKSKYETHVKPNLDRIKDWAGSLEEQQICKRLDVSKTTWCEYKIKFPELANALKEGRQDLIGELRSSLIKKAKGYKCIEKKVAEEEVRWPPETYKKLIESGLTKEEIGQARIVKTEISHKEYGPDVAAINLALKNYDKDNWSNDPQMLDIRKQELKLQEKKIESNEW